MNEAEKRNPNAAESEALLTFLAIVNELHNYEPELTSRLSRIPNGLKNYHWCRSMLAKLLPQILETVPDGKKRYFYKMCQSMLITIRYSGKSVSKADDGKYSLVHTEDMNGLIEAAKEKCLICLDGQCKRCPVGRALDNTMHDAREPGETWNDVWFRDYRRMGAEQGVSDHEQPRDL